MSIDIVDLKSDVLSKDNLSQGRPKPFKVDGSQMATTLQFSFVNVLNVSSQSEAFETK